MNNKNSIPDKPQHFIELRLQDINQLFNSMDPSPFREKELDADAEEFIISWAVELPHDETPVLRIHLEKPLASNMDDQMIKEAVKNHFYTLSSNNRWKSRQMLKQGWKDLLIGLAFLATCLATAQFLGQQPESTLIAILRESLIIGGWVAMWRPMEYFLYGRWPIIRKQKLYDRLSLMQVMLQSASQLREKNVT